MYIRNVSVMHSLYACMLDTLVQCTRQILKHVGHVSCDIFSSIEDAKYVEATN